MQLVLVTQYFDTLKSIGESDKTNTLFLSLTRRGREGGLGADTPVHAGGAMVVSSDSVGLADHNCRRVSPLSLA
jgi:hypothetical protein